MITHSPSTLPLSILAFGAGAIGTYISGSLSNQGNQVVFLERPDVAAELRQRGLRMNINNHEIPIPAPTMVASIDEALKLTSYDVAIFALKAYDTDSILTSIVDYSRELPPILCLQNGVNSEDTLSSALGADKVIPGTVTSAIGRRAAGDIVLERLRGMGIAAGHLLTSRLVEALNQAGLNAREYPRPADMKWSKMLTNLVGNATAAILDMTPAEIFSHPGLFRIELQQLRETLAVMDAKNIKVVNLPGTPVRLLAFAARYLSSAISQPIMKRAIGSGRGGKMPSFHIDLYQGRGKSEVIFLNGAVVKYGLMLGIKTPVNQFLTDSLMSLTNGDLPLSTFRHKPDKLIVALSAIHS
jgi:2-dehydropantoate 2-reductase